MNDGLSSAVSAAFQLLIVLLGAPLVAGVIRKMKARLQNRKGLPLLQGYADLAKLLKKEVVSSSSSSWLFRVTPYIAFASTLVVALIIPTVFVPVPLHWMADIITVVYLFALGRFFVALAALDTASAFGGLGSSREMSIASIVEPAMMLAIVASAVTAGSTDLSTIVVSLTRTPVALIHPAHIMAFIGLLIVTIAETGRIPVDNPATHLELTMIHEAMILEYSGRYLAFIEWASQMKLFLFLALLSNMFFPTGIAGDGTPLAISIGAAAFAAKMFVLALLVAVVESTNAKLRLFRVPELLMVAFTLSLLALILYFIIGA